MPHRTGALLLALGLLVGACGDDDAAESGADDSTATTEAGDPADDALPTTLAELIGPAPTLDPGAAQQWYLDREVGRQEAMVSCMAEAGFEYVPIDPAELAESPWSSDVAWESDEWVRTYGFGASTLRYPQSLVGPDLVGYLDDFAEVEPHPNQVYVAGLSAEDQAAWSAALNDCDASTWSASQAENLAGAFNEQFAEEILSMYESLAADPRYEEVHAGVRACVQEAGFTYTDHETALTEIEARLVPLDDEANAGALSPESLAQLGQIQADEVALATAVADCGGRFLTDNPGYQDLVAEYEAAFIAEHEAALRDFLSES